MYARRYLRLEGTRLFLILGIPFNPQFKIDVTCVYNFAIGSEALANGNKKKALEYADKAGVDLLHSKTNFKHELNIRS